VAVVVEHPHIGDLGDGRHRHAPAHDEVEVAVAVEVAEARRPRVHPREARGRRGVAKAKRPAVA
jgi:hypothetical protein